MIWARSLLMTFALLGCHSSPTEVSLGEAFRLGPGQSAVMSGGGSRLTFEGVSEDSRCPSDVVCVQAGEVVAELTIGEAGSRTLLRPGESAAWGRLRVRLVGVEPYPKSTTPIEPEEYRATFLVAPDSSS